MSESIVSPAYQSVSSALDAVASSSARYPSPTSWRDEVVYFLLPDRFSDAQDTRRPLLDRSQLSDARGPDWSWQDWAVSGYSRYQGGTLQGVISRLDYLQALGISTIWLGPCWKNRAENNDYHGYAIQHFLDVDPRFGSIDDLVTLVSKAHSMHIRVVLDIVINHTGENWLYKTQLTQPIGPSPTYRDHQEGPYAFGAWLAGDGTPLPSDVPPSTPDDAVWPIELQTPDAYHRAGFGDYGAGANDCSAFAEFRWADWHNRDLALSGGPLGDSVLQAMIEIWAYWLKLTDCDGFRIDTFKHLGLAEGRRFCASIKEYANELGKDNFLLVAEVGGGDALEERYLNLDGRNLSAVLEIGEGRQILRNVASGEQPPSLPPGAGGPSYFDLFQVEPLPEPSNTSECTVPTIGTHRSLGDAFVTTIDDHDNVWLAPLRFGSDHPLQVVAAVALLTLTLGIPCIYYGTEQGMTGPPENDVRANLPNWGQSGPDTHGDRYLREAMFGPEHPRRDGLGGSPSESEPFDPELPGFGAFGTSGFEIFDTDNATFKRVQQILSTRRNEPALRRGRQYLREIRIPDGSFGVPSAPGVVAWSRILATTEVICSFNTDGEAAHHCDVTVDAGLNDVARTLRIILDTAAEDPGVQSRVGQLLEVQGSPDGRHYVRIPELAPGEGIVMTSRAHIQ